LKKNLLVFAVLALSSAASHAQTATPTKIGIIHVQAAILNTKDGKKASDELNAKFSPRKAELDKKQANIDQLKEKLQKGSATLSDDAKTKLMRDIDSETKALTRANEDAQADVEQEEGKIYNDLGAKMYAIVEKYAKDNGYAMIIDVSAPQQPVWWASDAINITNEVIALYDKASTGGGSGSAAAPKAPAAAPTPRPAVPPAGAGAPPKKQ
jgi:outer membrane protein